VKELARVLIYGDIHLSSRNYGAHVDYPSESLYYFKRITEVAEERAATHIIGTGDFTYGRFNTLEYRDAVEKELIRQNEITEGRRYEVKGNHDVSTSGMTEYEFYVGKGLMKEAEHLSIGNTNINMVNFAEDNVTSILPVTEDSVSVVIAHDYFKFEDTQLPDFGVAKNLDHFENWFGVDHVILGHIHHKMTFGGHIMSGEKAYETMVHYLGCMPRPSYRAGHVDETADMVLLTIYEGNNPMKYEIIEETLWDVDKSFNLALKEKEAELKELKSQRLNISDIVKELNEHKRNVGNPEDIINALQGVDPKFKEKATQLLKDGLN